MANEDLSPLVKETIKLENRGEPIRENMEKMRSPEVDAFVNQTGITDEDVLNDPLPEERDSWGMTEQEVQEFVKMRNGGEDVRLTDEVDVDDVSAYSDSTEEEAADTIRKAGQLGIDPKTYKELKPELEESIEKARTPQSVDKVVAKSMNKSPEHAKVIKKDISKLNAFSKYWNFASETIKGKSISRDIFDIQYKVATGKAISNEERFQLVKSNSNLKKMNSAEEYGYSFWESVPAEFAGGVTDIAEGLFDGADLILTGAVPGAVAGALIGSTVPGAGTAIGAGIGGLKGAALGAGVAQMRDVYQQSVGQIYNDLTTVLQEGDDLKKPAAEDERRNLAIGGGMIMGALGFVPVGAAAKNIPWLRKIVNPRAFLKHALSAQGSAWKQLAIRVGRSAGAEGFEEGAQELVQATVEEMGRTWDGTETSFMKAVDNIASNKKLETAERVAKGAIIGAVVGGGISAGFNAIPGGTSTTTVTPEGGDSGPKVDVGPTRISDIINPETMKAKGTKAIHLKVAIEQSQKIIQDTNVKNLLPEELDIIRQGVFDDVGIKHIYIDKEDLNAWADNEEKSARAKKIIDKSGVAASQVNAPIRIDAHRFMQLVDDYPEIGSMGKADPDGPSYSQLETRVTEIMKTDAEGNTEINTLIEGDAIDGELSANGTVVQKDDVLEQKIINKIKNMTSGQKFLEQSPERQAEAIRQTIDDASKASRGNPAFLSKNQADKLKAAATEMAAKFNKSNREEFFKDIKSVDDLISTLSPIEAKPGPNPKLTLLINEDVFNESGFLDKTDKDSDLGKAKLELVKSLPDAEAKDMNEVTDLRTEVVNTLSEQNVEVDEEAALVAEFNDLAESDTAKAYDKITKAHIKEMKTLSKKVDNAIVPNITELKAEAKENIGSIKVKDLNVNQWKVGERRSQRLAQEMESSNASDTALDMKKAAALNSQLARATHIAIGKVNKAIKFIANLRSPGVQAQIQEAGSLYKDALNELLDLYGVDPNQKNSKDGAFLKFVEAMKKDGIGDFSISEDAEDWLGDVNGIDNMTVDQLSYLTDKIRAVVHAAGLKGKLIRAAETEQDAEIAFVADVSHEIAIQHPQYDPKNAVKTQGVETKGEKITNRLRQTENLIKNIQFIVQELDDGILGEFYAQLIYQPLDGTGKHEGPYGVSAKGKLQVALAKRWRKAVDDYGRSEFMSNGTKNIFVPEFAHIPSLSGGKVNKLQLITMLTHMGNAENRQRLTNFNVSAETIMDVLKRELTKKDFDFVQKAVWNVYAAFKPRIAALEKTTTGNDIDFTENLSFEAFGKTYQGGHMPIKYKRDTGTDAAISVNERLFKTETTESFKVEGDAFQGIVRSPHTKERTGSSWKVNLDFATISLGFEEVMHDLTMRVPVRDVMNLLKSPQIANDVSSIVGLDRYNALVNLVAKQSHSGVAQDILFQDTTDKVFSVLQGIEGAIAVNYIAFNPSSVIMSFHAIPQAVRKMGLKNGAKYLTQAAATITNPLNWGRLGEFSDFAAEIDPTIGTFRQGVDDFQGTALANDLPKKYLIGGKTYNMIKSAQDKAIRVAFEGILGRLDNAFKIVTVIASYNQFMNGDAPGWTYDKVMAMDTAERHETAKGYAAQLNAGSLMAAREIDKAPIQFSKGLRIFARFWNEQRNVLNNTLEDKRVVKNKTKRMVEKAKQGDFLGANLAFQDAGDITGRLLAITMLGLWISSVARDRPMFGEDDEDLLDQFDESPVGTTVKVTGTIANEAFFGHMPVVRDVVYGASTGRAVTVPLFSGLTDLGVAAGGAIDFFHVLSDEMDALEALEALSPKQSRAMLNTLGILTGGLPISAGYRIKKELDNLGDEGGSLVADIAGLGAATILKLTGFIDRNDTNKELTAREQFALLKKISSGQATKMEQAVHQAKMIRAKLSPAPGKGRVLTDEGYEIIKMAESGGKWRAVPKHKSGKKRSSAYGLYQFTRDTWSDLMKSREGKAAGLTARGRVSRNTAQQEKAIKIFTKQNAKALEAVGVPVNLETLYFKHHFDSGADNTAKFVYTKPDKTKLPASLRSKEIRTANPQLRTRKVNTVGDMKKYIKTQLDKAKERLLDSR